VGRLFFGVHQPGHVNNLFDPRIVHEDKRPLLVCEKEDSLIPQKQIRFGRRLVFGMG
jgi:hypothetical protein